MVQPNKIKREDLLSALERAPTLRLVLMRMARRAARGLPQPASFSIDGLDYPTQGMFERLMGVVLRRTRGGRSACVLPEALRAPSAWQEAVTVLGLSDEAMSKESVETFRRRLCLLLPNESRPLADLFQTDEVMRHLRRAENRARWQRILMGAVSLVRQGPVETMTLSQLGSQWLNDSKCLRSGTLRRQLGLILVALQGHELDEQSAFRACGIIDNPYTSFVTVFAPFTFETDSGEMFDFPSRLYRIGLATTLTSETVGRMRCVRWTDGTPQLVTSENAAPFARYVGSHRAALYTEGYPNYAVQRLLGRLGEAGVVAEHAGDADLDGFRIAERVARCLPVRRILAAEMLKHPERAEGIPLTDAQRERARRSLANEPDMPHAAEIKRLLSLGHWFEQETFDL